MEPVAVGVRQTGVDEHAEDLSGRRLPPAVEDYLTVEREWHRFLRSTGLVTPRSGGMLEPPPR